MFYVYFFCYLSIFHYHWCGIVVIILNWKGKPTRNKKSAPIQKAGPKKTIEKTERTHKPEVQVVPVEDAVINLKTKKEARKQKKESKKKRLGAKNPRGTCTKET